MRRIIIAPLIFILIFQIGDGLSSTGLISEQKIPTMIVIETDKPGPKINPAMWGIFFEDINFGADGGLYAELVKNRSFEFPSPLMGWSKIERSGAASTLTVLEQNPLAPSNPHYLRVKVDAPGEGTGISNEGFRGIGVSQGAVYKFSAFARISEGGPFKIRVELAGSDGSKLA